MPLALSYESDKTEAGADEAGRGCLAGPVVAAAVILPPDYKLNGLDDSKKLTEKRRKTLRDQICNESIAWSVGMCSPSRIDEINILNASFEAMREAITGLTTSPESLLIDGNRFRPGDLKIPYHCMIKGDGRFASIAAASILAKTFRDEFMEWLSTVHPEYDWQKNKGYPTRAHKIAIKEHGLTPFHRKSFNFNLQPTLFKT